MSEFSKINILMTNKDFVEKFGFEQCVLELLDSIEKDNKKIRDSIINKYLGESLSATQEEDLMEYFINNSVFSAATVANPATSVVTEFLYTRPNQPLFIDQYFFKSKGGKAIYSRLACVEEHLHQLIELYLQDGKVLIGSLGGGPSRDISDVFSKYYKDNKDVLAINIDRDRVASERGRRMAERAGVFDKISFLDSSFMRHKPKKKFDIILLVGVLCGLTPEMCVLVLKNAKRMLSKGGCILTSNVTPKMLEQDPFTYFIMKKITGWELIFKDEETLSYIFKKAGLKWRKSFTDEYGFHIMPIATH